MLTSWSISTITALWELGSDQAVWFFFVSGDAIQPYTTKTLLAKTRSIPTTSFFSSLRGLCLRGLLRPFHHHQSTPPPIIIQSPSLSPVFLLFSPFFSSRLFQITACPPPE